MNDGDSRRCSNRTKQQQQRRKRQRLEQIGHRRDRGKPGDISVDRCSGKVEDAGRVDGACWRTTGDEGWPGWSPAASAQWRTGAAAEERTARRAGEGGEGRVARRGRWVARPTVARGAKGIEREELSLLAVCVRGGGRRMEGRERSQGEASMARGREMASSRGACERWGWGSGSSLALSISLSLSDGAGRRDRTRGRG